MKSLVGLLEYLLLDCGRRSGAPVHRDVKTLRSRVRHEGDSFITITLPSFCRDFERSLDAGRLVPGLFLSFGKTKSGIPEFLQGFLYQVFDREGLLLGSPSADCIRFVRQICLFGKKIRRECSEERRRRAAEDYKDCDDQNSLPDGHFRETFRKVCVVLLSRIPLETSDLLSRMVPAHGPGATEEHISGNQKWVFSRWHRRLQDVGITYGLFGRGVSWHPPLTFPDGDPWPELIEPDAERPVRVVFVPKTLKCPRVIAVEPLCMQYAQQGLSKMLVRELESSRFTAGHVNFRDQTVNQALALDASGSGRLATLDMSEASDRVSNAHVCDLFESKPDFLAMIQACRSTRARLPNGDVVALKKFASMGSALCFPVEALVFFASIITSRLVRAKKYPDARNVYSFGRDVYVYGDDLIVPADEAPAICDDLETFGFRVNRHKSFWTGKFRESCGLDCYDNEQVTPVYLRCDIPTNRGDAHGLVSCIATANQLYSTGYWQTAMALREAVEELLGKLPQVPQDSPAMGWIDNSKVDSPRRWNKHLQRYEYLRWVCVSPRVRDHLDDLPALAKCLRTIGRGRLGTPTEPISIVDPEHLEQTPRPYALALKRRWVL